MSKIVIQLQEAALNKNVSVSELLQNAYLIARKLDLPKLSEWCQNELSGYNNEVDEFKPSYRNIHPTYKAFNPYRGYIPIISEDPIFMDALSTQFVPNPIYELEQYAKHEKSLITFSVSSQLQKIFNDSNSVSFEVSAFVSRSQYINIVEQIRKSILDWTLDLEHQGILGEELEFSENEKAMAKSGEIANRIEINGDNNIINAPLGGITENSFNSTETGFSIENVVSLIEQIDSLKNNSGLNTDDLRVITDLINQLKIEVKNRIPNPSRLSILFGSIKSIFENITGSVIAAGIIAQIKTLFPI